MPRAVWKYPLRMTGGAIELPPDALILTVAEQDDQIFMWVEVRPENNDAVREVRWFEIYGTGEEMPPFALTYIGTVMLRRGTMVRHVYEVAV